MGGTSRSPQGPAATEGEERELQMSPKVGREGGLGCLLSTQEEGGSALAQPNQTEKQMRHK